MLSIIISSYKPDYFAAVEKNIAATCGVPHEIIRMENPGIMGICEAYNKGAEKAKYSHLIFVHEDVEFYTENWGKILMENYFTIPNVGVIGFAGVKRRFHMCYGYGFNNLFHNEGFLLLQHKGSGTKAHHHQNPIPVKVIDGVFLGMKKELWQSQKFNENFLKGFHFYDIDFTLKASENHQNYLITDINLVHFSKGNFGNDWVKEAIRFNKQKNYNFDPATNFEKKQIRKDWYLRLKDEKINFTNRLKYVFEMGVDRFSRSAMLQFLFSKTR